MFEIRQQQKLDKIEKLRDDTYPWSFIIFWISESKIFLSSGKYKTRDYRSAGSAQMYAFMDTAPRDKKFG